MGLRREAVPELSYPEDLPVSARREDIAEAIRDNQVVIVAGETGSGKTTQLPKICLELGRGQRPKDYPSEQGLVPLLRALVAALQGGPGGEARKAIEAYEQGIRDMADFRAIYPLLLDLRAAHPVLFSA